MLVYVLIWVLNYWKYLICIFPIKVKVRKADSHIQIVPNTLQYVSELSMFLNLKLSSSDILVLLHLPHTAGGYCVDPHRSQALLQYTFPPHLPLFPHTHNLLSLQVLACWVRERVGLKSFGPATPFCMNRGLERKWLVQYASFAHRSVLCQASPVYSSGQRGRRMCLRGTSCVGLPCRMRDPLLPASQCGCGGDTWGSPSTARVWWQKQLAAWGQPALQHRGQAIELAGPSPPGMTEGRWSMDTDRPEASTHGCEDATPQGVGRTTSLSVWSSKSFLFFSFLLLFFSF